MDILTCQLTPFMANCFVIRDHGEAIVIDPGAAPPELLREVRDCRVRMIVNTHGHCDHCGGNGAMIEATGADLACHRDDLELLRAIEAQGAMFGVPFPPSPEPSRFLAAGDAVTVGGTTLDIRHVPGHSPGHIALVGDGLVFVGDVLFAGSIGRTDLPGGDHNQLLRSIATELLTLPDDTAVYSGHGPVTTIGEERESNPYLVGLCTP